MENLYHGMWQHVRAIVLIVVYLIYAINNNTISHKIIIYKSDTQLTVQSECHSSDSAQQSEHDFSDIDTLNPENWGNHCIFYW